MKVQDLLLTEQTDNTVEPLFEDATLQAVTNVSSDQFTEPVSAEQLLRDLGTLT